MVLLQLRTTFDQQTAPWTIDVSSKVTQQGGDRGKVESNFSIERDALGNLIINSVAIAPATATPAVARTMTPKGTRRQDNGGKRKQVEGATQVRTSWIDWGWQ